MSSSASPLGASATARCIAPAVTALSPELAKARDVALTELLRGHYASASEQFQRVLDDRPYDLASFALRAGADAMLSKRRVRLLDAASRSPVVVSDVPTPGAFAHALDVPAAAPPKLHLASKTRAHFGSTDWFLQRGIRSPVEVDPHDQNAALSVFDLPILKTFRYPDHRVNVFGFQIVEAEDPSSGSSVVFDFRQMFTRAAGVAPYMNYGVVYARVVGKALIVEICAMGIESAPATPNAFLAAVDIDSGRFAWVSDIRVAGAQSFIVTGGAVIASAGLTSGRLTVVELATGKLLDHVDIPFGPVYVVSEGREVIVQGGDAGEATFRLDDALAPAPPAQLPPPKKPEPLLEPAEDVVCEFQRALVALDARDGAAASSVLGRLPDKDPAANALRGVADFLVRAKEHPDTAFDLTNTPPIRLVMTDKPKPERTELAPPPALRKKVAARALTLTPNVAVSQQLAQDLIDVGDDMPNLVAGSRLALPVVDSYGALALSGSSAWPSGSLLYYAPKYIVTSRGSAVENVFDVSALYGRDSLARVTLHLGHMELAGERLLLSFSHRGPASELSGKKDFIAAFDRKTGAFLWQSDPLVSTTRFTTRGGYIIAAWGNEGEPSALFVIRQDTGETVSRQTLTPTPYELGWENGDLVIQNDDGVARYAVIDAPRNKEGKLPSPSSR